MSSFIYTNIQQLIMCSALPMLKNSAKSRHGSIANFEQTTSDLGYLAAQNIIQTENINPDTIGALVFLTKTPDYRGPATAMVLQNRLQISQDCIVFDSPTGNGGYESALNLGATLLGSTAKEHALVVFGDTISKQIDAADMETLNFQDGATAVLLKRGNTAQPVVMTTLNLSAYWSSFMVPSGGFRNQELFFKALKNKRVGQVEEHVHLDFSLLIKAIKPEFNLLKEKINNFIDRDSDSKPFIFINLIAPTIEKELASFLSTSIDVEAVYLSTDSLPQTMASTIPLMVEKIASKNKNKAFQAISVSVGEGLALNLSSVFINNNMVLKPIFSDAHYANGFVTHEM